MFGVVVFSVFYWGIPMWLDHNLDSRQHSILRPAVEIVFQQRARWSQWVGIAMGLVCAFFAVRNYFTSRRLGSYGERNVSFFSRLLSRWLD